MNQPRRSVRSIQPLPSIYTVFPAHNDTNNSSEHSGKCLIRQIEDGIEVVPLERSNTLSAPILSPDQAEKEVFIMSQQEISPSDKPLPRLPKSLWARLSLKQRVLAILGVQVAMLLTIGLALMAAKQRPVSNDVNVRTSSTADDSSPPQEMDPIPRGSFAIPVQLPQQQSSACLTRTNESVAWQCASDTTFQLNILPPPKDSNTTMIKLGSTLNTNSTLYHGHQAPDVQPVELKLMTGAPSSEDDGPVYQFRTTYDRVVLLKESDLSLAAVSTPQPVMRHPTFQSGETLWRCVFNETLIEGYIYANKKTTATGTFNGTAATVSDLPKIPHVLKLVEQRMPNGKGPYCEKMKVQDGRVARLSGEKVMLALAEPVAEANAAKSELVRSARFRVRQQSQDKKYCQCQWMVQ